MSVQDWSTTAATNSTADNAINMSEGMAASALNNNCRSIMAEVAKWRNDLSGNMLTGGINTAYTLTTSQVFDSLTDGLMVVCRIHDANGASPTLNVDGNGAKAINSVYGTAVGTGDLQTNSVHTFTYDSSDDAWIWHKTTNGGWAPGTIAVFRQETAPTGWTKETTHDDKAFRIVSGTAGTGGTTAFSSVLTDRYIAEEELPSHTHDAGTLACNDPGNHSHNYTRYSSIANNIQSGGNTDDLRRSTATWGTTSSGAHSHTSTGNVGTAGSGVAWSFDVYYQDVILAAKD